MMRKQYDQMNDSDKLLHNIRECSHLLRHRTHGKGGQERVLAILYRNGDMTQRELMDLVNVRSASLSEVLAKVRASGYIETSRSEEDKRNVDVHLTEAGKERAKQLIEEHTENVDQMFASLNEEEKQQMLVLMEKLTADWRERFGGDLMREPRRRGPHGEEDGCMRGGPHGEMRGRHGHGGPHGRREMR